MSSDSYLAARYSRSEEIANCITHGLGTILSIGGLAVLIAFASRYGNSWHIVSCSIFGATLILLYAASTLYHAVQQPALKSILRIFDHSAILVLIAGTYTPFTWSACAAHGAGRCSAWSGASPCWASSSRPPGCGASVPG